MINIKIRQMSVMGQTVSRFPKENHFVPGQDRDA